MSSALLTPEIVERADDAYWQFANMTHKEAMTAALEAVIPSLIEAIERKPETCADARCASYAAGFNNAVEECAKVAEEKAKPWKMRVESERLMGCVVFEHELYVIQILAELARDIRSLIPSKEKEHG